MIAMITGAIPWGPHAGDPNGMVTAESYRGYPAAVTVPANYAHWRRGDYICKHRATIMRAADGLFVLHTLDTERPEELQLYELVAAGKAYFSPGIFATPEAVRQYLQRHAEHWGAAADTPDPRADGPYVLRRNLDHLAYVEEPALQQRPAQVISRI